MYLGIWILFLCNNHSKTQRCQLTHHSPLAIGFRQESFWQSDTYRTFIYWMTHTRKGNPVDPAMTCSCCNEDIPEFMCWLTWQSIVGGHCIYASLFLSIKMCVCFSNRNNKPTVRNPTNTPRNTVSVGCFFVVPYFPLPQYLLIISPG